VYSDLYDKVLLDLNILNILGLATLVFQYASALTAPSNLQCDETEYRTYQLKVFDLPQALVDYHYTFPPRPPRDCLW